MNFYTTQAEKFEDMMENTTEKVTSKMYILRTQIGFHAVYSAMRREGLKQDLRTLWRFHEQNVLNYTDLNRNQFFIYGDQ